MAVQRGPATTRTLRPIARVSEITAFFHERLCFRHLLRWHFIGSLARTCRASHLARIGVLLAYPSHTPVLAALAALHRRSRSPSLGSDSGSSWLSPARNHPLCSCF